MVMVHMNRTVSFAGRIFCASGRCPFPIMDRAWEISSESGKAYTHFCCRKNYEREMLEAGEATSAELVDIEYIHGPAMSFGQFPSAKPLI